MPPPLEDTMTWEELCEYTTKRIINKAPKDFNAKQFYQWMLLRRDIGYLFDYKLVYHAYLVAKRLEQDKDALIVFSGPEGEGKSTLAIQFCSWVDPNFNAKRICMDGDTFLRQLDERQKGDSILLDEASLDLLARDAMSRMTKLMVKTMTVMRQKNLFVAICIPNFHLLDKYVKYHRIHILIQIKERGRYKGIIGFGIKKVAFDGYKYHEIISIKIPTRCFWEGSFRKELPKIIDLEEYKLIKAQHLSGFLKNYESKKIVDKEYTNVKEVARKYNVSPEMIQKRIQQGIIPAISTGRKYLIPIEVLNKPELISFKAKIGTSTPKET